MLRAKNVGVEFGSDSLSGCNIAWCFHPRYAATSSHKVKENHSRVYGLGGRVLGQVVACAR